MSSMLAHNQTPTSRHAGPRHRPAIYRHSGLVRIGHWINVLCMTVLLMSGLQIFNAHPALYWGQRSTFDDPLFAIDAKRAASGAMIGVTTLFGHAFETTGMLGLSTDGDGNTEARGFPAWATVPGPEWLAMGRRWHFFFAWVFVINGVVYALFALLSGHLWRDLMPTRRDLAHIGRSISDHLRFRFPETERYNVLQKIAYLIVAFGLGPLIILTGLTMSPRIDAGFPVLLDIFGGRQSARTLHFICAFSFLAFVLLHLFMVVVSGVWNNLRSMVTGRYVIEDGGEGHGKD